MLNSRRYYSPLYFSARYWLTRSETSSFAPTKEGRWGGQYFRAPHFSDPYFIRALEVSPYNPYNTEKWGGNYFGSGFFQDNYFITSRDPSWPTLTPGKYWPQWCLGGRETAANSELVALLQSLFTSLDSEESLVVSSSLDGARADYVGYPTKEWVIETSLQAEQITTFSVLVGTTAVTPTLTRSEFDYQTARLPIALVLPGMIKARNLDVIEDIIVSSPSGVAQVDNVPGSDDLIWAQIGPAHQPIPPLYSEGGQSQEINTLSGWVFTVSTPSPSLSGTITCQINSGPSVAMSPNYPKNDMDLWAEIWNLQRFTGETNYDLRGRIECRAALWSAPTREQLKGQIAVDFDLCATQTWDTSGSLNFTDSKVAHLPSLPQLVNFSTLAQPLGYTNYGVGQISDLSYAAYMGRVVPTTPVSGIFSMPTSGMADLTVYERLTTFEIVATTNGVSGLAPNRNTPPQNFKVVTTQGVDCLDLTDSTQTDLYNPDGSGTKLLKDLATVAQSVAAKTYSRSSWMSAYWFTDQEARPTLEYLPEELE